MPVPLLQGVNRPLWSPSSPRKKPSPAPSSAGCKRNPTNYDIYICRTIVAIKSAVTPNFVVFCHESRNWLSPIDDPSLLNRSAALMKVSLVVVRPNSRKRFHAKSRSREEEGVKDRWVTRWGILLKMEVEEFEQQESKFIALALPATQSEESEGKNFATEHTDGHGSSGGM